MEKKSWAAAERHNLQQFIFTPAVSKLHPYPKLYL